MKFIDHLSQNNNPGGRRSDHQYKLATLICLIGFMVAPYQVLADSKFTPSLGAQYIYYSNVYSLPGDGSTMAAPDGRTARADHALDYFAGFVDDFNFSRQQLSVDIRFNHLNYLIFTQLNHNEYTGDVLLKWKIGHAFDGTLGYTQEQSMVSFTELTNTQTIPVATLLLETAKIGLVTANMQMTPVWRLETGVTARSLLSPRIGDPDLTLDETTERLALRDVGISHLSFGLDLNYVDGKYSNSVTTQNPNYKQISYQLAADYALNGLSSFSGAAGYTKRTQQGDNTLAGNQDVAAVTGKLGYTRKISAKTGFDLQFTRAVNSYVTNVSSEIDTSATLGLNWQPTGKISLEFHYGITTSDFPNEFTLTNNDTRLDHSQFVAFEAKYQMLRTFTFKPYIRYEDRASNIAFLQYHGKTIGIEALGSW